MSVLYSSSYKYGAILIGACINDVPKIKIKIGKNQNQNWADYASLFSGNRCQTKEVPRHLMFIFWKIKIGGVHLIEGSPNTTRQRPEHSSLTQQQHVDRLHRHTIHTTSAAHGNGPKRDTISLPALLLFRSYNEVFVQTAFIPCYLSTDIDFVCVLCTSSSSAAVASLSLPLSLCVFLCCPRQRSQARYHFST